MVVDVERRTGMPQMSISSHCSQLPYACSKSKRHRKKFLNSRHQYCLGRQGHSLLSFPCMVHTLHTAYSNSLRPSPNYRLVSTRHTTAVLVVPTALFPRRVADSATSHPPSSPLCVLEGLKASKAAVGMVKLHVAAVYRRRRCRCLPLLTHPLHGVTENGVWGRVDADRRRGGGECQIQRSGQGRLSRRK